MLGGRTFGARLDLSYGKELLRESEAEDIEERLFPNQGLFLSIRATLIQGLEESKGTSFGWH